MNRPMEGARASNEKEASRLVRPADSLGERMLAGKPALSPVCLISGRAYLSPACVQMIFVAFHARRTLRWPLPLLLLLLLLCDSLESLSIFYRWLE